MSQKPTYKLKHCFSEKEDYFEGITLALMYRLSPLLALLHNDNRNTLLHLLYSSWIFLLSILLKCTLGKHCVLCDLSRSVGTRSLYSKVFRAYFIVFLKSGHHTHIAFFLNLWWLRNKRSVNYRCRRITCEHLLQHVSHWRTTQHLWEKQLLDNCRLNFPQGW